MSLHQHNTEQKIKCRQLRARVGGLSHCLPPVHPAEYGHMPGMEPGKLWAHRWVQAEAGRMVRRGDRGPAGVCGEEELPGQVSPSEVALPSLAFHSPTRPWLASWSYREMVRELPPEC